MQSGSGTGIASFEAFLEGWLVRQKDSMSSSRLGNIATKSETKTSKIWLAASSHTTKNIMKKNRWLLRGTSSSCSLLHGSPPSSVPSSSWIVGFKLGLVFRLVSNSVDDLFEDQHQRMNKLMEETEVEEQALNHELAKIQESVAAPPLMEILRHGELSVDGEIRGEDIVFAAWRSAFESVVANADALRTNTAVKVVEILNPAQSVRFLAAVSQLQLKIRSWGLHREAEARESGGNE